MPEGEKPMTPEGEKPQGLPPSQEGETPQGSSQGPDMGPEGKEDIRPKNTWASWLGEVEEISEVKSPELKAELLRIARRPLSMESPEMLEEAYNRIEEVDRTAKVDIEEIAKWGSRIGERHQQLTEKQGGERRRGISETFVTAAGTAAAIEAGEEIGKMAGGVVRKVGERILKGKGKGVEKEEAGEEKRGNGGEPPEKPPEEPPKEKAGLPDDFLRLQKLILDDTTPEDIRKKAMEKRDGMMNEFREKEPELFDEYTQTIMNTLKDSDWNHVKRNIANLADNLENEYQNKEGAKSEWKGMIRAAVIGESLRISKIGFDNRAEGLKKKGIQLTPEKDQEWLAEHGMWEGSLERLEKRVAREAFFPLGIEPYEFVGASLQGEKPPSLEELRRMAEEGGYEERMSSYAGIPPNEVVAVFRASRLGIFETAWKGKVEFLNIRDKGDLKKWVLLNMEAFNNGIIANPHLKWKQTIDYWLTDLRDAYRLADKEIDKEAGKPWKTYPPLTKEQKDAIRDTEKLIMAMMAVSASARAMEPTGGSTGKYGSFMTPGDERGPDLDKADEWAEFLLHGDPDKMSRVLSEPLVRRFYIKVLEDAGYKVPQEWRSKDKLSWEDINENVKAQVFDQTKARGNEGRVFDHLRVQRLDAKGKPTKRDYKGGFNGYINWLLESDDKAAKEFRESVPGLETQDPAEVWAAAKLACDAFQVDKYTRWEFDVTQVKLKTDDPKKWEETVENTQDDADHLKPNPGWGGNPLTAAIQPSFLPRHIKKVWLGKDRAVLDGIDDAFRPEQWELLADNKSDGIPASMVGPYKNYYRYMDAHWTFLGGSGANNVPQWTNKSLEELRDIAWKLDQAEGGGDANKKLKALQMAKIIDTKALAAAALSNTPGLRENLGIIFDPNNREMPFLEIRKALWGPDGFSAKSGFLADLASGERRFDFKDNPEAMAALHHALTTLITNDQTLGSRRRQMILAGLGIAADFAKGVSESYLGRR